MDVKNIRLGIVFLIPRTLCLIVMTITYFLLKSDIRRERFSWASDFIQQLIKDHIMIDVFGFTVINSFVTVVGSQLYLKAFLLNLDAMVFSYTPHFGMGFIFDLSCEMCLIASYLSVRNMYIFK